MSRLVAFDLLECKSHRVLPKETYMAVLFSLTRSVRIQYYYRLAERSFGRQLTVTGGCDLPVKSTLFRLQAFHGANNNLMQQQ
jgi:hypothetical protein